MKITPPTQTPTHITPAYCEMMMNNHAFLNRSICERSDELLDRLAEMSEKFQSPILWEETPQGKQMLAEMEEVKSELVRLRERWSENFDAYIKWSNAMKYAAA
jgi:hypothetical protein